MRVQSPSLRLAVGLVLAASLLGACWGINRPEGVVERWLRAANEGPVGNSQRFATDRITGIVLPESRQAEQLEVIEVGRGTTKGSQAHVPFSVVRRDRSRLRATAELRRDRRGWQVVGVGPADQTLPLPSEGGADLGTASPMAWLAAAAAGAALAAVTAALMAAVKRSGGGRSVARGS